MVRVISGSAKGIKLYTPAVNTRPTLDRVKEAMFSMIQCSIEGSKVLDLFAGSGALGIEMLSRGAEKACFVDKSSESIELIKENLRKTALTDKACVMHRDYAESINILKLESCVFDVLLLDPPYKMGLIEKSIALADKYGILSDSCIILAEHAYSDTLPESYGRFIRIKDKKYGTCGVCVYSGKDDV